MQTEETHWSICTDAEQKKKINIVRERLYEGDKVVEREWGKERNNWRRCRMWSNTDTLHTDAFTQRRSYAETRLHTNAFTYSTFYTQTPLHTHTDAFTHRRLYTQKLFHTGAFAYGHLYALRAIFFTHRRFYTQARWHIDAFKQRCLYTHRRFYTQTLSHANVFTHTDALTQRCLYTQTLWHIDLSHTDAFAHTHKRFYTHLLRTISPNCEVGINRARKKKLSKNEWEKEVRQGLNAPCPWRKIQNVATCNCCWKLILPKSVKGNQLQIPANAQIAH